MSYLVDMPHPSSRPPRQQTLSSWRALRLLWRYPRQTLAELSVSNWGNWLIPVGLALVILYLRLLVLLWLGQPLRDVIVVRGALSVLVGWPLAALLLYGCCQWLDTRPQFLRLLLLTIWSTLPLTLRGGMQILYTLLTGHVPAHAGLSGLLATGDHQEPLLRVAYGLLSQVDLFVLWHLLLLLWTVHVATGVSLRRAGQGVVLYAGFVLLLGVIVALLAAPN